LIALQVHITAGPQAGARLKLSQSPVTFGRSPDNTLVLDLSTVSRNHGELRYEDDQWWLYNLSQNGTKVGRKRVTKKPRALEDGASVLIGDEEVFRVYHDAETEPPAAAPAHDTPEHAQPETAAPGTGAGKRSKLWIIIGVWLLLCVGLFVLLATTIGKDDNGDGPGTNQLVRYADAREVRQVLKREVERETPDDYLYTVNIEQARQAEVSQPRERFLYEAYDKYREATRYLPEGTQLEPQDRQRYDRVLDDLAELIYLRFDRAHTLYGQNLYEDVIQEIDQLREFFPANPNEDPVAAQIMRLRGRASARAD
jgi:hypothetical protein